MWPGVGKMAVRSMTGLRRSAKYLGNWMAWQWRFQSKHPSVRDVEAETIEALKTEFPAPQLVVEI
jgi:hypothetical protein